MWNRSVEKNKLQYTECYGDGDSKSSNADIEVKKLECIGNESDVDYEI